MPLLTTGSLDTASMERLALFRSSAACRRLAARLHRPRPFSSFSCNRHGQRQQQQLRNLSCSSALRWRPVTTPFVRLKRNFSFSPVAVSTSPRETSKSEIPMELFILSSGYLFILVKLGF